MPEDDMTEEETKGLFKGKFWVDGYTAITVEEKKAEGGEGGSAGGEGEDSNLEYY